MRLSNLYFGIVALAFALTPLAAHAAEATYKAAAFKEAQAAGKHIVVEVFKNGCPTCKLQQPGLKEAKAKYPNAMFVTVDFEGAAAPLKTFKVVRQSTIIVFKGETEVARTVGETNADAIVASIGKGA